MKQQSTLQLIVTETILWNKAQVQVSHKISQPLSPESTTSLPQKHGRSRWCFTDSLWKEGEIFLGQR